MAVIKSFRRYYAAGGCLLLLSSASSWGQSLEQQIAQRLQAQHPAAGIIFEVTRRQPTPPLCDNPQLSLPGSHYRLTGNFSVRARCHGRDRFVQVQVKATGYYQAAKKPLEAGARLQADDILLRHGALEKLPTDLVFQNEGVVGSIVQRRIAAGEPLEHRALRKPWRIHNGERVNVVAAGSGFSIHRQGRALGNAAVNDNLRVRMTSGKTIAGRVGEDGVVNVSL